MKRLRFRLTIWQLVAVVAACAVLFWLLRTPAGLLVLSVVLVLPGFAIDRARGGSGTLGAMLAGAIMMPGCVFAYLAYLYFVSGPLLVGDPAALAVFLATMGLCWGALVSFASHLILRVVRSIRRYGMPGEPGGPITEVIDRGLP
jgi:hypothetical protein